MITSLLIQVPVPEPLSPSYNRDFACSPGTPGLGVEPSINFSACPGVEFPGADPHLGGRGTLEVAESARF